MNGTCLIMMAAYNGELYIEKQICSIINQSYQNWKLIIQDDGSTDNSIEIIKKYTVIDSRIQLLHNHGTHGPYYNFHSLINTCRKLEKFDYYMFSDHDDVWDQNKIIEFIEHYKKYGRDTEPILLYADMRIIDDSDSVVEDSIDAKLGIKYRNAASVFFCHSVFGCNTFFNRALFEIVPEFDICSDVCEIMSHDNYFAKYAAVFGKILFLDKSLMGYRRHDNNVTSVQSYSFGIKRIMQRVARLDELAKWHARTYRQSLVVINMIQHTMCPSHQTSTLNKISKCIKRGGVPGTLLFIKLHVSCGNCVKTVSHAFVIFLGIYKKYL